MTTDYDISVVVGAPAGIMSTRCLPEPDREDHLSRFRCDRLPHSGLDVIDAGPFTWQDALSAGAG